MSDSASFVFNRSVKHYCLEAPFDPPEFYPELSFIKQINDNNTIYPMVRELFHELRMDSESFGTRRWNPFKDFVKPGYNVVIKPNLVTHQHHLGNDAVHSTIVHGSVIRPIIDYVTLALGGKGTINIVDNPIVGTDFKALMDFTGILSMIEELLSRGYSGVKVIDLRPRILKETQKGGFCYEEQQGDPMGYVDIDLGSDSFFSEFDKYPDTRYYTLADPSIDHVDPRFNGKSETDNYHHRGLHKYTVSRSILNADLIISVAKMKTHCKAGVTLTLKNLIGMVQGKGCMPHWRQGLPPKGDAFPFYPPVHYVMAQKLYIKLRKWLRIHRFPKFVNFRNFLQKKDILVGQYKHLEHGNWKGNDTIWRTILDLNRIAMYADKQGGMQDTLQRKYLGIIDGIIAQQGNGPMAGDPIISSIIFGGYNPVNLDTLAIKAMGIDPELISTVSRASDEKRWSLIPNNKDFNVPLPETNIPVFNFKLPKGWM